MENEVLTSGPKEIMFSKIASQPDIDKAERWKIFLLCKQAQRDESDYV